MKGGAAEGEVGAITLFGTLMDYHGALQRYSLQIKGRYIEVRSKHFWSLAMPHDSLFSSP